MADDSDSDHNPDEQEIKVEGLPDDVGVTVEFSKDESDNNQNNGE